MSKPISSFYEATKYLGQFIGEKVKFLQNTSCMDPETRELNAILNFAESFIENEDKEIFNIIRKLIDEIGYARWQRDTVTDMALKKGSPSETELWGEKVDDATIIPDSPHDGTPT